MLPKGFPLSQFYLTITFEENVMNYHYLTFSKFHLAVNVYACFFHRVSDFIA